MSGNHDQYIIEHKPPYSIFKILPHLENISQATQALIKRDIWTRLKRELRYSGNFKIKSLTKLRELQKKSRFSIFQDSQSWEIVYGNQNKEVKLLVIPIITSGSANQDFARADQKVFSLLIYSSEIKWNSLVFDGFHIMDQTQKRHVIPIDIIDSKWETINYIEILDKDHFRYSGGSNG